MATKLDLALAQFTGFYYGKWNRNDIIGLVIAMGMNKKEWIKIKDDVESYLTEKEIEEINEYFKSGKEKILFNNNNVL